MKKALKGPLRGIFLDGPFNFRQKIQMLKKSQPLHLSNLATKLDNLVLYILIVKKALKVIIERFYFWMVHSNFKQTRIF